MAKTLQEFFKRSVHIIEDFPESAEEKIINVIHKVNDSMTDIINEQFNIKINVPLLLEAKIGNNWLDTKDVP